MKTILKLFLAIILLSVAAFTYAAYTYKSKLENYIQTVVTEQAKASNINLAFEEFNLNLLGAKAKAISLFIPKALLSLTIDQPAIDVPILSALGMAPAINVSGKLYESDLRAHTRYDIKTSESTGNLSVENLDLTKMPQIAFLGLLKGVVNASLDELKVDGQGPQFLRGKYSLQDLKSSKEHILPTRINRIPTQIRIPRIEDLDINGTYLYENNLLIAPDGRLNSDLGNVAFNLEALFNKANLLENMKFTSNFALSSKGLENFGYLLPQISNNILSSEQKNFTMTVEGKAYNLKYSFKPN